MADELDLDLTSKKKKKKAVKVFDPEEAPTADGAAAENDVAELDFDKKKKKKKPKKLDDDEDGAAVAGEGAEGTADGAEPDYTYDDLLNRVYDIMRERNPDLVSGDKKKFVMVPPQVARVGTRKTAFTNFTEICRRLNREPKHLLQFLLAELGTSGSIDGNNHLVIKGRFQTKHIENVLRKYIKEYVTCHTCKSPQTNLQKDTRLFFLQCATCGSRCSVASIKTGFQAVTTKRARTRAAAPQ